MAAPSLKSHLKNAKTEQLRQKAEHQVSSISSAEKNTTISKKKSRDEPVVIKQGIPLDHTLKHSPYEGSKFGMSKGITKNMGDYESLRVDVWLTDDVHEGETLKQAVSRVEKEIDYALEKAVENTLADNT